MTKIKKYLLQWYRWYIHGSYHCDKCPMCWEDRYYDGDSDCGCYIYGDLRDSCRLLPIFRNAIGWPIKKILELQANSVSDYYTQWYLEDMRFQMVFLHSMEILLTGISASYYNEDLHTTIPLSPETAYVCKPLMDHIVSVSSDYRRNFLPDRVTVSEDWHNFGKRLQSEFAMSGICMNAEWISYEEHQRAVFQNSCTKFLEPLLLKSMTEGDQTEVSPDMLLNDPNFEKAISYMVLHTPDYPINSLPEEFYRLVKRTVNEKIQRMLGKIRSCEH